jgi:hypothetical protein
VHLVGIERSARMHAVESFKILMFITAGTHQLTQYSITLWTLTDLRSCYVPEGSVDVAVQYTCRHLGLYMCT